MSIKLEIEKVVIRGERLIKLISINMLREKQLPSEYLEEGPYIRMAIYGMDCITNLFSSKTQISFLVKGIDGQRRFLGEENLGLYDEVLFSPEEFTKFCEFLKKCGQRLHEINKRLREENKKWKGTSTIEI